MTKVRSLLSGSPLWGKNTSAKTPILARRLKRIHRRLVHRIHNLDTSELLVSDAVAKTYNNLARIHDWETCLKKITTAKSLLGCLDMHIETEDCHKAMDAATGDPNLPSLKTKRGNMRAV